MSDHNKEQKSSIDPATSKACVDVLVGNNNQPLKAGSWSVKGTRIISGNLFRAFNFGEQLIKHGVDVSDNLEAMKAATIALSPELPPFGLRGELGDIMTGGKTSKKADIHMQAEPQQQQPQGVNEE
jgi:hypothetical protein